MPISTNAKGCFAGPIWVDEEYDGVLWRHRVCWVPLECPTNGNRYRYWCKDDMVSIDASITPIILKLNEMGYQTRYCCSKLPEDHVVPCEETAPYSSIPYISFSEALPSHLVPKGARHKSDGSYLGLSRDVDKARAQWQWLAGQLGVKLL